MVDVIWPARTGLTFAVFFLLYNTKIYLYFLPFIHLFLGYGETSSGMIDLLPQKSLI